MSRQPYLVYFKHQSGSRMTVFRGREYQRGHGMGSMFSGLFRLVKLLLMRGAEVVGKQELQSLIRNKVRG